MTRHEPGRLPQTTEGADLLEVRRSPSPWARRLLWTSLAALAAAGALLLMGVFPPGHAALRQRPETHVGDHGLSTAAPGGIPRQAGGAPAGG